MSMLEDFSVFFNTQDFADVAAWTPAAGGPPRGGAVIYDENGEVLVDFGVSGVGPVAAFPTSQWPGMNEADTLEIIFARPIGSRSYRVRSVIPLDDGAISLATLVRL